MIDIGERAGSGIPNIFRVWHDQKWQEPVLTQSFEPDRTTLLLYFEKSDDKKVTIKSDDKKVTIKSSTQKTMIVDYLTDHITGTVSELSELLGVKGSRVKKLIYELITDDIVVA